MTAGSYEDKKGNADKTIKYPPFFFNGQLPLFCRRWLKPLLEFLMGAETL